jgi:hypothetical protein
MHTKFWSIKLKGRELGRPRRRWKDNINIKINFSKIFIAWYLSIGINLPFFTFT